MIAQNLYETFLTDPVEVNMKHLKTQLFITLITLIREKEWTQKDAAKKLHVSAPRMSNLFKGYLDKFSIDTLLEMLVRIGYKLDVNVNLSGLEQPLSIILHRKLGNEPK